MTALAETDTAIERSTPAPLRALIELAPSLVPVLYEVGEKTWPRRREHTRKRWGVVGPEQSVRENGPRRFAVLLRRLDLATLTPCWRLEAGGPVDFFEWDPSGRVHGSYGVRYPVISVAPVVDEGGQSVGFAVNPRGTGPGGAIRAIDARVDSAAFIRSGDAAQVADAVRSVAGSPRIDEFRPGMDPPPELFVLLRRENKSAYFLNRGANEYVGGKWTVDSVGDAVAAPGIRAVCLGHPDEPSATPEPAGH